MVKFSWSWILFFLFFLLSLDAFPSQFFSFLDFDVVEVCPVAFGQDCCWQE